MKEGIRGGLSIDCGIVVLPMFSLKRAPVHLAYLLLKLFHQWHKNLAINLYSPQANLIIFTSTDSIFFVFESMISAFISTLSYKRNAIKYFFLLKYQKLRLSLKSALCRALQLISAFFYHTFLHLNSSIIYQTRFFCLYRNR